MNYSLFVGTFNCGNNPPNMEWIKKEYDVYAIVLQECPNIDFTNNNFIGENKTIIINRNLWQIKLIVFCRNNIAKKINNVECKTEATGIFDIIPNKGAIYIGMSIGGMPVAFIGAHLTAHYKSVDERNNDIKEIFNAINTKKLNNIYEYEHIFFFGDLNYRISRLRKDIINDINKFGLHRLWSYDQLYREMTNNGLLSGFKEEFLLFKPTYKFDIGTRNKYSLVKNRRPAWCDRILYRSLNNNQIKLIEYSADFNIMTSDHSPVYATFILSDYSIIKQKKIVILTEMCGIKLISRDINKKSDPYVVFYSRGNKHKLYKTKICYNTLNPVWKGEHHFKIKNLKYIFLVVKDYDFLGGDDIIGYGYVDISNLTDTNTNIKIDLIKAGKYAGTIKFKIKII